MRLILAMVIVAAMMAVSASAALAGEITGNGKLKPVNGNSFCAYSGQEDLQWYLDQGDTMLNPDPIKGEPGHSQNWGQIPQSVRDQLTALGYNPGIACNPQKTNGLPPL